MEQTPLKIGPKDVFLHLLGIITLYASAISLATLLFQYIDLKLPNIAVDSYYYRDGILSSIRFAVSTLIVVFPVYFWTTRRLRALAETDPERRNFGIRRWLGYFTLFLAGSIAIGWLVAVINKFLEGDFTTAFLLKALVIFFVTGSTFYYYRAVTQGSEARQGMRWFGYGIALVVLASIVAAFFVVGSPTKRRAEKADAERVSDLGSIQYEIGNYYRTKQKLPTSLADLSGAFGDETVERDPLTGASYEYGIKGPLAFTLCATFDAASVSDNATYPNAPVAKPADMSFGPNGTQWHHEAGHQCFDRVIDKDYFRPTPAIPVK